LGDIEIAQTMQKEKAAESKPVCGCCVVISCVAYMLSK